MSWEIGVRRSSGIGKEAGDGRETWGDEVD